MTDAFAEEYRQTTDDVEPDFVEAKTDVQARVVGPGRRARHRAPRCRRWCSSTSTSARTAATPTYTPYRALVTVVHTDRGWLVSASTPSRTWAASRT